MPAFSCGDGDASGGRSPRWWTRRRCPALRRRPPPRGRSASRCARHRRPQSARISRECCPGWAGGVPIAAGVRLNRGAGAGCIRPSTSTNVPRAALCGMDGCLGHRQHRGEAHVGAVEQRAPLVACPRDEQLGEALLQTRPRRPIHLGGELLVAIEAQSLQQLGVELRLDRTDRDVLAIGCTRTRRRSARRCRAGWCRDAARRRHRSHAASRTSTSTTPHRRPSPRRRPVPAPLRCASSSAHTTPKARNIAPPP